MKTYRSVIEISKETADKIQELLDYEQVDLKKMDYPRQSCIHSETAEFEDGCMADIKLCSSDDDFFIDAVLFDKSGCEIGLIDISYEILSEFEFEQEDETYIVEVKLEMEKAG